MNQLDRFLENVNFLNNSIKRLLNEDGIISPPNEANTVNEKFLVIEDGVEPKDNEINLKDAKKYKSDVEVGEEIEIPVVNFDNMSDSEFEQWLKEQIDSNEITFEDVKQLTLGAGSSKVRRTVWGMVKTGPKIAAAAGRVMLLRGLKRKIPHSQCYCVRLFDANIDETAVDGSGDPDPDEYFPSRDVYEGNLADYIDTVRKEFLDGWDECVDRYDEFVDKPNKKDAKNARNKALDACPAIDDWVLNAKSVLDKILGDLQKYYNIKGIEVTKKTLGKTEKSIAKSIGGHEQVVLHFENPLPQHGGGGDYYPANSDQTFKIGTYKEEGNVVKLIDGTQIFYFEFQKTGTSQKQTGSVWKDDGTGKPASSPVSWKGWIVKYIN